MANRFIREPITGGDDNAWAPYLMALTEAGGIGGLTAYLYNDGGVLKLSKGFIGINDGTVKGVCVMDTVTTISLAGVTNELWAKIEVSISGTSVTVAAADIAAATDPATLPSTFKNAYDPEKGGFYIATDKRTIGLVWKNSSGVLLAVIRCDGSKNNWWAAQVGLHTATIHTQKHSGDGMLIDIGTWNMNVSAGGSESKLVAHGISVFNMAVRSMYAFIITDGGLSIGNLDRFTNAADPKLLNGGFSGITSTNIVLYCRTGGDFDSTSFNDAVMNRGYVLIRFADF